MERSCDFWKRPASPPVLHHRSSGDDAETGLFREHRNELVGHAIGEVVLGGISGQVVEGKHARELMPGCWLRWSRRSPRGVRAKGSDGDGNE